MSSSREYYKAHYKAHPWLKHYRKAKERCYKGHQYARKGIRFLMTMKEFKELWFRDEAWLLKEPSIDRIDPSGDYIKHNCRFIERSLNCLLGSPKKPVSQYALDGTYVKDFESGSQAICSILERKATRKEIQSMLDKIRRSIRLGTIAYGYRWKYAQEIVKAMKGVK